MLAVQPRHHQACPAPHLLLLKLRLLHQVCCPQPPLHHLPDRHLREAQRACMRDVSPLPPLLGSCRAWPPCQVRCCCCPLHTQPVSTRLPKAGLAIMHASLVPVSQPANEATGVISDSPPSPVASPPPPSPALVSPPPPTGPNFQCSNAPQRQGQQNGCSALRVLYSRDSCCDACNDNVGAINCNTPQCIGYDFEDPYCNLYFG